MPPSEIRKEAREALKGKWGKGVCIVLAYLLISFVIGLLEGLVGEESVLYTIIDLAYLVISVPLSFGLIISFTKLKRGEDVKAFGFIKDGLSRFKKSWGIAFRTFLKLLLPFICVIVVIVLMTSLVIVNTISSSSNSALSLIGVALYIAVLVYVVSRALLYTLSYYIGYDNPELSSKECVLKSEELMKGNRGNYFLLELSFIGWILLACLTLGLGMLWVLPYMQVAAVCFYERVAKPEIKESQEEVKIEE